MRAKFTDIEMSIVRCGGPFFYYCMIKIKCLNITVIRNTVDGRLWFILRSQPIKITSCTEWAVPVDRSY